MNGNLILFRADGGPDIGMGHIMRCLALAKELKMSVIFLSRSNQAVEHLVDQSGFSFYAIKNEEEFEAWVKKLQPVAVVVDNYTLTSNELNPIKQRVPLLVAIDDLNDRYLPADLLINGNITATELGYTRDKRLLLGHQYALLHKKFKNCPIKKIATHAKKVMVTVGGSDPLNLMPQILTHLIELDVEIKGAIGPQFTNKSRLLADFCGKRNIELMDNPDMFSLMCWADIAISASGSTLYEICATGTPAVVFSMAKNQMKVAQKLGEAGYIKYLGFYEPEKNCEHLFSPDNQIFKKTVTSMLNDTETRAKMSSYGQALIDGRGAERCAEVIRQMLQTKN